MFRKGNWTTTSYYKRSTRARMGLRKRGVRMSYWQRVAPKVYASEKAIEGATQYWMNDLHQALNEVLMWAEDSTDDIVLEVVDGVEEMAEKLEWTTPKDPEGPNDPPLHAKDSWRVRFDEEGKGNFILSVSNPKHYIQFLEAYGGVHDSHGNLGGPDPGWISDIFEEFALRLRVNS